MAQQGYWTGPPDDRRWVPAAGYWTGPPDDRQWIQPGQPDAAAPAVAPSSSAAAATPAATPATPVDPEDLIRNLDYINKFKPANVDMTSWGQFATNVASMNSGSMNELAMDEYIRANPMFQQAYTYLRRGMFGQSQNLAGEVASYESYAKAFDEAMSAAGLPSEDNYKRMFFSSGITTDNFTANLQALQQNKSSLAWQTGQQMSEQQKQTALFNTTDNAGTLDQSAGNTERQKLAQAFSLQKSYLKGEEAKFGLQKVGLTVQQEGI